MGILLSALSAAGNEGVKSIDEDQKQQNNLALQNNQSSLEIAKAKAIADYQESIKNAPTNRAGVLLSDASNSTVPVSAAPVAPISMLSGIVPNSEYQSPDGNPINGLTGSAEKNRQLIANLPEPYKSEAQAQLDRQVSGDQSTAQQVAQDAVAGQTRPANPDEAMTVAMAQAKAKGDIGAYLALKAAAGDKFMQVGANGAVVDTTKLGPDGKPLVVFQNTKGEEIKTAGELAKDTRLDKKLASDKEIAEIKAQRENSETGFTRELKKLYPEGSPQYEEALRQRINKEVGIATPGAGRSVIYNNRIIASGNEVAAAITNIMDLPATANKGVLGFGQSKPQNFFTSSVDALKNKLNTDEINGYNVLWTGVARNLGTLETSGLAATASLVASIDKLAFVPGDTGITTLRKVAEVRQITEAALAPKLVDPTIPKETKDFIQNVINNVKSAVPFTHSDITKFIRESDNNKDLTLQEFAKSNGISSQATSQNKTTGAMPLADYLESKGF